MIKKGKKFKRTLNFSVLELKQSTMVALELYSNRMLFIGNSKCSFFGLLSISRWSFGVHPKFRYMKMVPLETGGEFLLKSSTVSVKSILEVF